MEYVFRQMLKREVKLKKGHSFCLPHFPGEPLPPRLFTSTYFDTVDFRLARLGVTLRRKAEQKRVTWQLKLPRQATQLDMEMDSGRSSPPTPLEDLLFALVRREPLTAIAKLQTRRSGIRVQHDDKSIADVAIDRVRILNARRVIGHLSEITVELRSGKGKDLTAIVKVLREAGAHDGDSRPAVFQALNLNISESCLPETTPFSERLKTILQKQLRDILGRHQDAIVTEERLRQLLQTTRGVKTAFTIGQIIERLRTRRHKTKVIFPGEWAKLKKRGREVFAP